MFNKTVKPRISGPGIVPKDTRSRLSNLVYLIIFLTKLLKMGCLGSAWRRDLSCLLNPFNLKILDLHLEEWLCSPLICEERALQGGVDIWDYVKTYIFNNFVCF